jgi:hypothetical protein
MKRNMDLIRLILLHAEGSEAAGVLCEKFTDEERSYHTMLLIDAGLVEGTAAATHSVITRLTWAGHDFLDAMRDDTLWKKAKEHVIKPGASFTFDVLKEWLKFQIKAQLGMP